MTLRPVSPALGALLLCGCAEIFGFEEPIPVGVTSSTTAGGAEQTSASQGGGGTGQGAGGSSSFGGAGGAGGDESCPGTAPGCVVDWVGQYEAAGAVDGVGNAARFEAILGVTGADAFIYVTDNHAVRRIDLATATVTTWAGELGTPGFADGTGASARFDNPVGITGDATRIWLADAFNCIVREIDLDTAEVTVIAGQVGVCGSSDGAANVATLEQMRDLVWDGVYLYLVQSNHVVRRIHPETGAVDTIAGMAGSSGIVDGTGAAARFSTPRHIEATTTNRLYVGDTENHRPRYLEVDIISAGVTSPFGSGPGYSDGTGAAAQFNRLRGLAYDGTKRLFVADADNYCIRSIDLETEQVTTIAGMAQQATHVVAGGLAAGFDKPQDLYFDAKTGDLFIVEGSVLRRMYAP